MDIIVALEVAPQQLGVRARVWHPTRSSCRTLVAVLLGIGAGGGNYCRAMHQQSCWKRHKRGDSAMGSSRLNTKGQGFLHVANPASIRGPPTSVVGPIFIPLVLIQRLRRITFWFVFWNGFLLDLPWVRAYLPVTRATSQMASTGSFTLRRMIRGYTSVRPRTPPKPSWGSSHCWRSLSRLELLRGQLESLLCRYAGAG